MGADLSSGELEWTTPKDAKSMEQFNQWIKVCIMSPEEDWDSIEEVLGDLMDSERFHGFSTEDGLFDEAYIDPIMKHRTPAKPLCFKTYIKLHPQCTTWDSVT